MSDHDEKISEAIELAKKTGKWYAILATGEVVDGEYAKTINAPVRQFVSADMPYNDSV